MKVLVQAVVFLSGLFFSLLVNANSALTCPSVDSVRHLSFSHIWIPFYVGIDEEASDQDVQTFANTVISFERAQYDTNADPDYADRCQYTVTSELRRKIVLAHRTSIPPPVVNPTENNWQYVIPKKLAECVTSNEERCPFDGDS